MENPTSRALLKTQLHIAKKNSRKSFTAHVLFHRRISKKSLFLRNQDRHAIADHKRYPGISIAPENSSRNHANAWGGGRGSQPDPPASSCWKSEPPIWSNCKSLSADHQPGTNINTGGDLHPGPFFDSKHDPDQESILTDPKTNELYKLSTSSYNDFPHKNPHLWIAEHSNQRFP